MDEHPLPSTAPNGQPRLTIVIPTVNRAYCLPRAIESALAQTARDIEIIVSNNGSRDGTRAIIDRYSDPRLRVFHRENTIPACAHGNFLVSEARGELFLGLSDDDYLEPDFATSVLDLFSRHPDLAFAYTGCTMYYADVAVPARTGPEVEPGAAFIGNFLAGGRDVCWCACVTRTRDLRAIGAIPPGMLFGDMYYWTRIAFSGPVGCIAQPLSHYVAFRDLGDNLTGGTPVPDWAREVQELVTYMIDHHPARGRDQGELEVLGATFLARSTADQFVWNALRGMPRHRLVTALPGVFPLLRGGGPGLWLRILAAIVAPRPLLRQRVLLAARRKAASILARKSAAP